MTGEPTLKCVIAWSERRNLCSLVSEALKARIPSRDVLTLGDDSLVVYGVSEPSEVRNWIAGVVEEDESALVVEFERWSSKGPGVDAAWLMRRGHQAGSLHHAGLLLSAARATVGPTFASLRIHCSEPDAHTMQCACNESGFRFYVRATKTER